MTRTNILLIVALLIITSLSVAQERKYVDQTINQPLAQYTFPITKGIEADITTMQTQMGVIKAGPSAKVSWKNGALNIVTKTIGGKTSFAGYWHCVKEKTLSNLTLNAKKAMPWPIKNAYQAKITGLYVIAKGKGNWKLELKSAADKVIQTWQVKNYNKSKFTTSSFPMPTRISLFKLVNLVVETNSSLTVDEIGFEISLPRKLSPLRYAYLTSLGQMLGCYDPTSGLVRDKSFTAIGENDSVPALGFAALSAATAADLGYIQKAKAKKIAKAAINNLLTIPAHSSGFLPHFTKLENNKVVANGEFSTIDTALAYLSAYSGAAMLKLNSEKGRILKKINALDFDSATTNGKISHGFDAKGKKLKYCYEHFGSEVSLLTLLAKLKNPDINFAYSSTPPVYGGRGFIMEMMPMLYRQFGGSSQAGPDGFGNNWYSERVNLLMNQKNILSQETFIGGHSVVEIVSSKGKTATLEGGSGGPGKAEPVRGKGGFGTPWVAPHYAAMTAALEPDLLETRIIKMMAAGLMPPLTGPAESALLSKSNEIKLILHRVVSLNAWFNLMGYYHAIVAQEGRNDAVYAAAEKDATLATALETTFNAGSSGNNYTVSGFVKENPNIGILGVRLDLSGNAGFAFTDSTGYYSITLPSDFSGTLTPSRDGFIFEPTSTNINNVSSNQIRNFTAVNNTHKVSGYVKTSGGQPVESAVLNFTGSIPPAITDSSGYFARYIEKGYSGTITPQKFGYVFTPGSAAIPTLNSDFSVNFEGNSSTNSISGVVKSATGLAVQGVLVNFSNGGGSALTDDKGEYTHAVTRGWSGDVTPSLAGFTFDPEMKSFSDVTEDKVQNFTASQSDFTVQAESGTPINHSSLVTPSRSNAENGQTALIKRNMGIYVNITVAEDSKMGVIVRYSNDNLNASPNETVTIIARNVSTGQETQIDQFIAKDTGDYGMGWNVFEETGAQGPKSLKAGTYQLKFMVSSGDGYGIEFDCFKISFTQ